MGMLPRNDDSTEPSGSNSRANASNRWWKAGAKIGLPLLGLGGLGFVGISLWVSQNLAPTIAEQLSKTLERDVKLGPLTNIGFNEISFGPSSLPATPTSASTATVKGIRVGFDPLAVLWQRTLKPNVTLIEPDIYLEQDAQGNWLKLPTAKPPEAPGFLSTEIQRVTVQKAKGTIVPYRPTANRPHIVFQEADFNANFKNGDSIKDGKTERVVQLVEFDGGSNVSLGNGAKLNLKGNASPVNGTINLEAAGISIDARQVSDLAQLPAVNFRSGIVDGNLSLNIQPQKPLDYQGNFKVRQATIQIIQVPELFQQTSGDLKVSSQSVVFSNVSTLYGKLPGQVTGEIDFKKGYNLKAQIPIMPAATVLETLKVKSPVALSGQFSTNLSLTGDLEQPLLSGSARSAGEVQVDKLSLQQLSSDFAIGNGKVSIDKLTANPKAGGSLQGSGEVLLTAQPQLNLTLKGQKLPANLLAQPYQTLPVALGLVDATARITGPADNISTAINLQAPQAQYPLSADLAISAQGAISLRQGRVQVAGRNIVGSGTAIGDLWQAKIQVPAIDTQSLATLANQKNAQIPDFLKGQVSGNLDLQGSLKNSDRVDGKGQLQLATAAGVISATGLTLNQGKWQADLQTAGLRMNRIDKQLPGQLAGKFKVTGDLTAATKISAVGSGSLDLPSGRLLGQNLVFQDDKWRGDFSSSGVDLAQVSPGLKGIASGKFALNGDLQNTANIQGKGQALVQLATGRVVAQNLSLAQGQWQGDFRPEGVEISQFNPAVRGRLSGQFNLAGNLQQPSLNYLQGSGTGRVDLAQGQVMADRFQLKDGRWQGDLALKQVRLGQLSSVVPTEFQSGVLNGNFQVAGVLDKPTEASLSGDGRLNWNGGQVAAQNLQVKDGAWQGMFAFQSIALNRLPLKLPPNFRAGLVDGNMEMAGRFDKPSLQTANGTGRLRLPGATAIAEQFALNGDSWQGRFKVKDLPVGQFANLPAGLVNSRVTSNFELTGNLTKPQQLSGSGSGVVAIGSSQVALQSWQVADNNWQLKASSAGLDLGSLGGPAALRGSRFAGNANLSGPMDKPMAIEGQVSGNLAIWGGTVALTPLNLSGGRWQGQIAVKDIELKRLTAFFPSNNIKIDGGRISAQGQGSGSLERFDPKDLSLDSAIALTGLQLTKIPVEQNLQGRLRADRGNLDFQVAGQRDQLALKLNDRGLEFSGNLASTTAKGSMVGDLLQVQTSNLPAELIVGLLPPLPQLQKQQVGGIIGGDLSVNLKTGAITSKGISIDQPQLGLIKGTRFSSGTLSYANGMLEVNDSHFQRGDNGQYSYDIAKAQINTNSRQPEYLFVVKVPNGSLADVSNLFQIFDLEDLLNPFGNRAYGRASDLKPAQASYSDNLNDHLERQSELNELAGQEQTRREENPLPDLRRVDGDFNGTIVVSNMAKQGVYSSFDIHGKNWSVDQYPLSQVELQGKWQNNVFTLAKLELTSPNAKIKVQGDFGLDRQQAKIEVDNFPADRLSRMIGLPVEVGGNVNVQAELGGTWFNPTLAGGMQLQNGKLNQSDLPAIDTKFGYKNSRLVFNSTGLLLNTPNSNNVQDPLMIKGSIPYQLPFAQQAPDNNEFLVNIDVKNQGLRALSILTQQQADWVDGIGQVNLVVQGKMGEQGKVSGIKAKGDAVFQNGVVQSSILPDKLTAVNGQVSFDLDRVQVAEFSAKYGSGEVKAKGGIGINNALRLSDPLEVSLDKLQVDLKDKYTGGVSGRLSLGNGSLVSPTLSGDIQLFDGQIMLPETSTAVATSGDSSSSDSANPIKFQGLNLSLEDNVRVDKPPVLSFFAKGKVELNTVQGNLQPLGTLELQRGQANLFTSRFRLKGGGNTVTFTRENGADPILNVLLTTKALETSRPPSSSGNERQEKTDLFSTSVGSVQTIQVDAKVIGPASQATTRLDLSSKPPRNRDEILILLGNGLGQGTADENAIGLGLINLASSTFITNVQESVTDLFGLSDFRIYPALTRSERSTTSTLGLAAEVGMELNSSFSASVFKIITSPELPQYSIRYRIDDQFLLRGSSNLSGDSRVILEFDRRF
jgi:translocation and assembly module TamB